MHVPSCTAGLAAVLVASLLGVACARGPTGEGIRVEDAYVPEPPPGSAVVAVYMSVVNAGGEGDRLVEVACPWAASAEMHETVQQEGVLRMVERTEGYPVPPRGRLQLEPGGAHLMLIDLDRTPAAGDEIPLELRFERAGRVEVAARVRGR